MRKLIIAMVASLAAVVGLGTVAQIAGANAPEAESSKAIMKKLNGKAATAVSNKLKKEFGESKPNWAEIKTSARSTRNSPPNSKRTSRKRATPTRGRSSRVLISPMPRAFSRPLKKRTWKVPRRRSKRFPGSCKACHNAHK